MGAPLLLAGDVQLAPSCVLPTVSARSDGAGGSPATRVSTQSVKPLQPESFLTEIRTR